MKACARHRYGADSLSGKTVALQGCGSVGYHLARLLHTEGARIVCTDIDPQRVKRVVEEVGAQAVATDAIYDRSEEHTSELQSRLHLVCRLLLEKKKKKTYIERSDCNHMS